MKTPSVSNNLERTLVVCAAGPPQINGTASVMYELLKHFPPDSILLVTRPIAKEVSTDNRVLKVRTYQPGRSLPREVLVLFNWLVLPLVFSVIMYIRDSKIKPKNVLAVFPSLEFLLSSVLISKILGIPLFVYLHDCIVETAIRGWDSIPARVVERLIFGQAKKIFSISGLMTRYYRRRGIDTDTLPHGAEVSLMRKTGDDHVGGPIKIGFSGLVYETNADAIKDLVYAKKIMGDRVEIHIATPEISAKRLVSLGLTTSIADIRTVARREDLLEFLSRCTILFVPMSFKSKYYRDLLTVFPTKTVDYWLAQRPILVYGPKEYAFVNHALENGYAKIVTEKGPKNLASAIQEISDSRELRESLVEASKRMVFLNDSRTIADRLMRELGITEKDSKGEGDEHSMQF